MMGHDESKQAQFMFICLDDYVPQDHLLRQILKVIDFSFIYAEVRNLYASTGRRSIDPVLLVKMLLIGYLYGIPSERKLEQEVKLNLAYRWFLGLDLPDPVPDHSTLSQNRRRRFKNSGVFQEIFDTVVRQCIEAGVVTGEIILTDATHIKAHAAKDKLQTVRVEQKPSEYLMELENTAQQMENELRLKRDAEGKKKCGKKPAIKERMVMKKVVQSKTDPDAGLLKRPGKPSGFHYLSHTSLDAKNGIITDVHVTAANLNDFQPYIERIQIQKDKFSLLIQKTGADKGYDYPEVYYGLARMGITGYIPSATKNKSGKGIKPDKFHYDGETDTYQCPEGKSLKYTHINHRGNRLHKIYAASAKDCKNCIRRNECFGPASSKRTIIRTVYQELVEKNSSLASTQEYIRVQKLRRTWCEGTFGLMKREHNLGMTYKRGRLNVLEHCLFSALAINLKRMVKLLA